MTKKSMSDCQRGVKFGVFNAKRLTKRLEKIHRIAKDTIVLGICETWLRKKDAMAREALDETEEAPESLQGRRGFGGVAFILNPIVKYTIVDRFSSRTIQFISIRIGRTSLTVIYVSPRAGKEEEEHVLGRINGTADGRQ